MSNFSLQGVSIHHIGSRFLEGLFCEVLALCRSLEISGKKGNGLRVKHLQPPALFLFLAVSATLALLHPAACNSIFGFDKILGLPSFKKSLWDEIPAESLPDVYCWQRDNGREWKLSFDPSRALDFSQCCHLLVCKYCHKIDENHFCKWISP